MQSRFNPLLLVSVLIGLASMAAVVPAWAFAPFAVTTAAAGLYLAYTRSGSTKPIDPDEDKIYDLGQCAFATELERNRALNIENAEKTAAIEFYDDNKPLFISFWKQEVTNLFIGQDKDWTHPDKKLSRVILSPIELQNQFEMWFPRGATKWTDINKAKISIRQTLDRIRERFIRA